MRIIRLHTLLEAATRRGPWVNSGLRRRVVATRLIAGLALATAACSGPPASLAQKRADFISLVGQERAGIATCNNELQDVQISVGALVTGDTSIGKPAALYSVAGTAHDACRMSSDNAILNLPHSPPSDLSSQRGLSDAVGLVSVWADFDAATVMTDLQHVAQDIVSGNDNLSDGSKFNSAIQQMDQDAASIGVAFKAAATAVGDTGYKGLGLVMWKGSSSGGASSGASGGGGSTTAGTTQVGSAGSANAGSSAASNAAPGPGDVMNGASSAPGSANESGMAGNLSPSTSPTETPSTQPSTAPTPSVTQPSTAPSPSTTRPPTPEAAGCTSDTAMVHPSDIYTSCDYGNGHESADGTKGDSEVWAVSWSSWGAGAATGTGTYYTGTGQGANGQDGPQWGVDIQLSSPNWVGGEYLFTHMTLTCDSSVPPPAGRADSPADCSSMSFTLPNASGQ